MAGVTELLRILVDADTGAAVQNVERFGSASKRELDKAESSLDKWGNRLSTAGAGMVTFGSVAIAGLVRAGDAASDLNEVQSKSTTVFGESADEVDRFATNAFRIGQSKRQALDAASGFGNLFDQLSIGSDQSAEMSIAMSQLASDMASFHNADITEVLNAQQAAFRGEYDELQRYVPTLNAAAVEQRALAETGKENADALTEADKALATYSLMLEGAGAAMGDFERTSDSNANKQRIAAAQWENLKASIGEGAIPAMSAFLGVASEVMDTLQGLNAVTDGTAGQVATIGSVALIAVGGLSMLVGQAIKARENLSALGGAMSSLKGHALGMGGAVAGAATAAVTLGLTIDQMQDSARRSDIADMAEEFLATGEAVDAMTGNWEDNFQATRRVLGAFAEVMRQSPELAQDFIDQAEAAGASEEALNGMRAMLDRHTSANERVAEAQQSSTEAVSEGGEAMGETAEQTDSASDALDRYRERLLGHVDALADAQDAQLAHADAQAAVGEANVRLIAAQDEYNQAVADFGPNSDEAREAAFRLMEAQNGVADADRNAIRATSDLDGAMFLLRRQVQNGEVDVDSARRTLQGWVRQGLITQEQASRTAGEFDDLAGSVRGVPGSRTIAVATRGSWEARQELHGVSSAVNNIPSIKNIQLQVNVASHDLALLNRESSGLYRADGGPVRRGVPYWVGERGRPELMIPDSDGMIVTEDQVNAAMAASSARRPLAPAAGGSGGGGMVVNIYTGADPRAVIDAIATYERANGTRWRTGAA